MEYNKESLTSFEAELYQAIMNAALKNSPYSFEEAFFLLRGTYPASHGEATSAINPHLRNLRGKVGDDEIEVRSGFIISKSATSK